jgi:hypothetical protein
MACDSLEKEKWHLMYRVPSSVEAEVLPRVMHPPQYNRKIQPDLYK